MPLDPQSPFVTSGLRIGTPSITTRGMKESDCERIADLIADVVENLHNDDVLARVAADVKELTARFPLYPELG